MVEADYPIVLEAVKGLGTINSIPEFKTILEDKNNLYEELKNVKAMSEEPAYCEEDL